jgi:hypothetical protein
MPRLLAGDGINPGPGVGELEGVCVRLLADTVVVRRHSVASFAVHQTQRAERY